MSQMVLRILVLFLFVGFICSSALDCRKFVFAPVCRGIIAKRGHSSIKPIVRGFRSNGWARTMNESPPENIEHLYFEEKQTSDPREPRINSLNRDANSNDVSLDSLQFPSMDYNSALRLF